MNENINNMSCEDLMNKIQATNFSLIELALCLDTHPDDRRAIYFHNQKANELRMLTEYYQKLYGPLTIQYPCDKWRWLEQPWPWEKGGNCSCGCTKKS